MGRRPRTSVSRGHQSSAGEGQSLIRSCGLREQHCESPSLEEKIPFLSLDAGSLDEMGKQGRKRSGLSSRIRGNASGFEAATRRVPVPFYLARSLGPMKSFCCTESSDEIN